MKLTVTVQNRQRLRDGEALLARTAHRETYKGIDFCYVDCPWCYYNHCHMNTVIGRVYYAPCGAGNRGKMYEIAGE